MSAHTDPMVMEEPTGQSRGRLKLYHRRRRRLKNSLLRMSSASQLHKGEREQTVLDPLALGRSVSCGELEISGPFSLKIEPSSQVISMELPQQQSIISSVERARSPPKTKADYFSALPVELQIRILAHLKPKELAQASLVSKRWHALCYDGQLWTTFDASEFYREIPVERLSKIVEDAGPFVRHLNLRGCINLQSDWRITVISTACRNLLSANFEGCSFSRDVIHNFVGLNSQLIQLNLSGQAAVTNTTCRLLASNCQRLESLDISWCPSVDSRGIKKIVDACPGLKELRASEIRRIDEYSTMQALFRSNSLERLSLSGCDTITDESIRVLVEGKFPDIDPLTGRAIAPPRKLKHLDLSRCIQLSSAALKHMARNAPDLEGLQLSGCEALTDEGFQALIPTLTKLTHLDLEECSLITNATVLAIAEGPCAKTLKHLQLSFCELVNDAGLVPLAQACTNLNNLELDNTRAGNPTVDELAYRIRARITSPPTDFSSSTSKTDNGAYVGLRLVIYDCPCITWHGVQGVLARNSTHPPSISEASNCRPTPQSHGQVIQLKCYYGWQMTCDEHLKRVLRGHLASAKRIETKWTEHMVAAEDGGSRRRRRRRGGDGSLLFGDDADDDEDVGEDGLGGGGGGGWLGGLGAFGVGGAGGGGGARPALARRRRGASCAIM